jgi:hypothetical protein
MFGWLKRMLRREREPVGLVFTNEEAKRALERAERDTGPTSSGNPRIFTGADGKPKDPPGP